MPNRERKFGPYRRVHTVDVTGLRCNIKIFGIADDTGTMPVIVGAWFAVGRVKEEVVPSAAGIELILTDGSGSVSVSRTGNATAGPGGSAVTGVRGRSTGGKIRVSRTGRATAGPGGSAITGADLTGGRPIRTHVVQPNDPYRQTVPDSPVDVSLFVVYGTRVLY